MKSFQIFVTIKNFEIAKLYSKQTINYFVYCQRLFQFIMSQSLHARELYHDNALSIMGVGYEAAVTQDFARVKIKKRL